MAVAIGVCINQCVILTTRFLDKPIEVQSKVSLGRECEVIDDRAVRAGVSVT